MLRPLIGTPTLEEFYGITSRRSRDYIRALPIKKKRPLSTLFPKASPEAIDFLSKTLVSASPTILLIIPSSQCNWDHRLLPSRFREIVTTQLVTNANDWSLVTFALSPCSFSLPST